MESDAQISFRMWSSTPSALLCGFEQSQHTPAILCIPCALTIWKAWLHCIAARTVKGKRKRQFNYKQKELNLGDVCHGFLWSKAPLCGAAADTEPEEGVPQLTCPKNKKGRRNVSPRHIQDWNPSGKGGQKRQSMSTEEGGLTAALSHPDHPIKAIPVK